jgi:hypothetical protein
LPDAAHVGERPPAHEAHRIDLQQQRSGATRRGRHGIEHVRAAVGERKRLQLLRMLGEQISEIGRGLVCGRQGQQHGRPTLEQTPSAIRIADIRSRQRHK